MRLDRGAGPDMQDDGDIDYSAYSLRELEEGLAGINKHRYPRNYANLCAAYERITGMRAHIQGAEPPLGANDHEPREPGPFDKFWNARPVRALLGLFCLWWSHDLFHRQSCPSGRRLTAALIEATCERFGQHVAAGLPLVLGLVLVCLAAFPRRAPGTR
jgi:hypothetical protein